MLIPIILIALLIIVIVLLYNKLINKKNQADNSIEAIDALLKSDTI